MTPSVLPATARSEAARRRWGPRSPWGWGWSRMDWDWGPRRRRFQR